MASFEQQPDLQSYTNFRPYEMPYNQLAQTVQAKTNYWLAGANQLKSAQQNAAGLDLSLDQNKDALSEFNQKANSQVTQAAKSDLSIGDNVNDALHIFDPLYNGQTELSQNIMGDHAVTTKAKQVQQQFQEAKTKNNGKEYSAVNEQDSLKAYYKFVKNGDPTGWKNAYQGLKNYQPYYDYHKEINDNLKNCKPSSASSQSQNGMYIQTQSASGLSASQVSGCVGSNLSAQAENQMAIEGRVKYGDNYKALADDYQPVATRDREYLASQRATLAVGLKDPNATDAQKKGIQDQLNAFDHQIGNIDDATDRYKKGDYSFFQNNYDTLAAATYRGQKLQSIGSAFAYVDRASSIKADPVTMMYARFKEDQSLATQRQNFELAKMKDEYGYKMSLEEWKFKMEHQDKIGQITPMTPATDPSQSKPFTQADFDKQVKTTNDQLSQGEEDLYQHLLNSPVTKDIVSGNPRTNPGVWQASKDAILKNGYIANQDPWIKDWKDKNDKIMLDRSMQLSTQQAVENNPAAVAARNTTASLISSVSRPERVGLSAPTNTGSYAPHGSVDLSPQDIKDLLQGKSVRGMSLGTQDRYENLGGGQGQGSVTTHDVLNVNGQPYSIDGSNLHNLVLTRNHQFKDYDKTLSDLYASRNVSSPTWGNLSNYQGPEAKQLQRTLASNLGGLMSIPEDKDLKLTTTSWDGKVRFTIPANNKGKFPDQSSLTAAARQMGYQDIQSVPGVDGMYEVTGAPDFNRSGDVEFSHKLQTFAENLQRINSTASNPAHRTPMFENIAGVNISAVRDPSGGLTFELQDASNPSKILYESNPARLAAMIQQLKQ